MSRNFFRHTVSAKVALVANTLKTVLQLVSDTNVPTVVTKMTISVDVDYGAAEKISVRVLKQSTAGTMTGRNPASIRAVIGTLQATGNEDASAEPTAGTVIDTITHTAPKSYTDLETTFDNEIEVGGGERLGVEITSDIASNCTVTLEGEE